MSNLPKVALSEGKSIEPKDDRREKIRTVDLSVFYGDSPGIKNVSMVIPEKSVVAHYRRNQVAENLPFALL